MVNLENMDEIDGRGIDMRQFQESESVLYTGRKPEWKFLEEYQP